MEENYHQYEADNELDCKQFWLPQLTLAQYLPLVLEGWELYGLSVFCLPAGGTGGMGTHFRRRGLDHQTKSCWTGDQRGSVVHFRLREGETILGVWARPCLPTVFPYPYLAVYTVTFVYSNTSLNLFLDPNKCEQNVHLRSVHG